MKQMIIFAFLLSTTFCTQKEDKKNVQKKELTIENESIKVHDTLHYEIENLSSKPYFYLVLRMNKFSYQPPYQDKNSLAPAINRIVSHIYKGKDSLHVNQIITSTSPFFVYDEDEEEYNSYVDSLKQQIVRTTTSQRILKPNESVKIKTVFRNYEIDEITDNEYRMLLDNTESYHIQLSYTSDSTFVKQNISKELLDSLRKNNIKIFHGTIYSNKVPLKFEK
ncbi:hypothetical protein [Moheibacter lacus]|uniref:Uncharacterized protein n=1 Tax=Moheibacter lacus TaxID=2745851 RepID=A0A838ZSD3_9FLAO|nr:hypothetical protein [Moheibacter lacus]MBA5629489.1 hypothetical protein [Moheibacter lacus]